MIPSKFYSITFHSRAIQLLRRQAFSSSSITSQSSSSNIELSYLHKIGVEPLRYANIGQVFEETANKYPDRFSLISCLEDIRITFAESLEKVDRLACSLLNLGLERGDHVALWAPNYEFWFISKLAIARAGLICVTMNPAYQVPEMEFCLKKIDAKAIIAPEKFLTQNYYEMLAMSVPSLRHTKPGNVIKENEKNSLRHVIIVGESKLPGAINYHELLKSSSEIEMKELRQLQTKISPDSCVNVQFTSGTTGTPKATMLSHFGLTNCGRDTGTRIEQRKLHAKMLNNLPFFHIAGTVAIMQTCTLGSTLVLPAPHFNAELSLRALASERCNYVYGTPNMYLDMIAQQMKLKLDLPVVENAIIGAAVTPAEVVRAAKTHLNIKTMRCNFGMTETSCVGFGSVDDEDESCTFETVGHLADHAEAKIIDKNGDVVPMGEPGELCLRGYFTMLGYYGDSDKTKEVLGDDKWLKTGDQFILTKEGYGKIVGRLKEMIIRGGENVFPREIEDFLHTHPNIREVHVIGIPDDRMGEEIGAFIKYVDPTKPMSHSELRQFSSGKISHFKLPKYLFNVERDFPKTSTGKVHKIKFLEFFAEEIKAALSQEQAKCEN